MPASPSHLRVHVEGGDLTVAVHGDPGAAEPVLAVHGITASSAAWLALADVLDRPLIAPDLRGRGGSGTVPGPFGMAVHARDCLAVLDALGVGRARVVGHSMGGFVASVLAHRHPGRVAALVLVDGGAPLPAPGGDPDRLLGPAAARLRMRFPDRESYRAFWRGHPAFADWTPAMTAYVDYDLIPDGDGWRSAVAEDAVRADFLDLHSGVPGREAFAALPPGTPFVRAERGLLAEPTPLYPDLRLLDALDVRTVAGSNHYSILFGADGVRAIAAALDR